MVSFTLLLSFNFLVCKMGTTVQNTGQYYLRRDLLEAKATLEFVFIRSPDLAHKKHEVHIE